ncbi:MAG: hypothetical protein RLZZ347_495 [Candidatus Parcubacteria bacterium]
MKAKQAKRPKGVRRGKLNLLFRKLPEVASADLMLVPISGLGVDFHDFVLGERKVPVGNLPPEVVARIALTLASRFAVQSDRFTRMAPKATWTVGDIVRRRIQSTSYMDHAGVLTSDVVELGIEVTVPKATGGRGPGIAQDACLVFGFSGRFVFAERGREVSECVVMELSEIKDLADVVARFPDLTWVLTKTFFPELIKHLLYDVNLIRDQMTAFQALAWGVSGRLTYSGTPKKK